MKIYPYHPPTKTAWSFISYHTPPAVSKRCHSFGGFLKKTVSYSNICQCIEAEFHFKPFLKLTSIKQMWQKGIIFSDNISDMDVFLQQAVVRVTILDYWMPVFWYEWKCLVYDNTMQWYKCPPPIARVPSSK